MNEERRKTLRGLHKKDSLAVECARRFRAFTLPDHGGDYYKAREYALNGACFLLITWGPAKQAERAGKLVIKPEWVKQSITIWANVTVDYFEHVIKPIIEEYTTEELQETFGW